MSLYHTYRPRDFSSVVGQEFAKKSLANACRLDKIHHGYILHGSHGIGKTTLARILAKSVNCTSLTQEGNPCHACENCCSYDQGKMIDVVEIDAASHTGVENIRDLIEKAQFQPTRGKYKIYIIDEVHMLSKGAFNALLKILEEPPAHVIFILATTEIHRVPDTILSRVMQFDLRKISESEIHDYLAMISEREGIQADEEALRIIAQVSAGGMRDAISLFEQYIIDGMVSYETIKSHLHLIDEAFFAQLILSVKSAEQKKIQESMARIRSYVVDPKIFFSQFLDYLHQKSIEDLGGDAYPLYRELYWKILDMYAKIRMTADPLQAFEMIVYEVFVRHLASSPAQGVPDAHEVFDGSNSS